MHQYLETDTENIPEAQEQTDLDTQMNYHQPS